jgi:sulfur relay (sulfurtransferase) DsrF/TusC family protein
MREDELARMQLDTVITGMAVDESANLGWYEDGVLGDGY